MSTKTSRFEHQMVKLEDVCEVITDGTHQTPTYVDEGITFLSSKNVKSGRINWDDVKYVPESLHAQYRKRIQPQLGDLLLAKNGTTGVGALVDRDDIEFSIYVSLALLRPLDHVDPEYLLRVVNNPLTTRQFNRSLKGVGVPNLHLKEIRKAKIPLPPIAEQKRIAAILDAADAMRVKRREAIAQLDALLKSTFIEMFGDPVTNPMGWGKSKLEEITHRITDGKHGDCRPDPGSGYFFVSVKDLKDGRIEYRNAREILKEDFIDVHKRTQLEPLDVLITNSGTIGRTVVVTNTPETSKTTFQKSVAIVKPKQDFIDSYFLKSALDFNVTHLMRTSSGSSQKNLLLGQLRGFRVTLPPLDSQKHFATAVASIEKQKKQQRVHLAELDTLFASLQSRAFNGEL